MIGLILESSYSVLKICVYYLVVISTRLFGNFFYFVLYYIIKRWTDVYVGGE